jgi:hypothetical protein
MIARLAWLLALLVACTDDNAKVLEFDNQAEHASTWQLTFGTGTILPSSQFTGDCPSFAPRTMHLPDGQQCDPGFSRSKTSRQR